MRDNLNKRRRELEGARDDLNLLGERKLSESEARREGTTSSGQGDNNLYPLQENTQEIPPYRGKAETAVVEPATQQNREDLEPGGGSPAPSFGRNGGAVRASRQRRQSSR